MKRLAQMPVKPHPAKFTNTHLEEIVKILGGSRELNVLDPFAGVGTIHNLPYFTRGLELEPEWADQHHATIVGDALDPGFDNECFDAVVTSPCFGNRMADSFKAKDDSKRHTYHHYLGRPPSKGSSAIMQWGKEYKEFHRKAWLEAKRVLVLEGKLIINIKDHIRNGEIQPVTKWHIETCLDIGLKMEGELRIPVGGLTHGENYEKRIPHESLLVFSKKVALEDSIS